jgi:hypothetical protein
MNEGPNEERPQLHTGNSEHGRGVHARSKSGIALKCPFPYFGGKSKVAELVWRKLGDPSNYIEPFCGSAAVLLGRPTPPRIEAVNDADCYLANFWRSTQHDPEAVATHADWPVNEADLHSRHRFLVLSPAAAEFREKMRTDPEHYDPRIAGWWCWGLCCWIGSGWCSHAELREDGLPREKMPKPSTDCGGVHLPSKRPLLAAPENESGHRTHLGRGVHAKGDMQQKRPRAHRAAGSSNSPCNRPQLADAYSRGRGVHGNDSAGTCEQRREWLIDWFGRLRDRLRTVRVCCGDWLRVCDSPSVTTRLGITGIFLDPPYAKTKADGTANRSGDLYANDKAQDVDRLVKDVRAYCLERGSDPMMRIVLAGYEGEGHEVLESHGWDVIAWKASGGYGNRSDTGKENAARERLWISPHCVKSGKRAVQESLFAEDHP